MRSGDARLVLSGDDRKQLEELLERLQQRPDERGVVTLGDINFDFDRANLKPGAQANLRPLAEFLLEMTGRSVLVEGHTDDTGVLEYNFDLSRRRADEVKSKLVDDGVDPERIVIVGYGPVYPVASNQTPTGRARNRRVEIVVLGRGEKLEGR